jgi:glycosyltransferase involved in cell wall biosynthesis
MLVRHKHSSDDNVIEHTPSQAWSDRIPRRLYREKVEYEYGSYQDTRPSGLEPFSDDRVPVTLHELHSLEIDVLNLHWVAEFVDYRHLFQHSALSSTPIVWRLSDMNPFTGGCHYNMGCAKFRSTCGACPQLGSTDEKDLARQIWRRKSEAFEAVDAQQLHFVAQSRWIAEQVASSPLTERFGVTVIPNGVDHHTFFPRETEGVKRALNIEEDRNVLLFVAHSVTNKRKGFEKLAQALDGVPKDVMLVSIGNNEPEIESRAPHLHLGRIQSNGLLSVFYSLADLFVIPSRQDNLPNTVLESMACGTPVVGFDTGGIPDMVRPDETGWLAETGNVRALRQAIEQALADDAAREQRGQRGRAVVEEEYTLERQARRYRHLYERLVRDQNAAPK